MGGIRILSYLLARLWGACKFREACQAVFGASACESVGACSFVTLSLAVFILAIPFSTASAQDVVADNILRSNVSDEENKPLLLQADEVIYDNQNNQVRAKGNVEIYYNNHTLLAESVIYDQTLNTLSAKGNVRIKEPGGAVINADSITLTDDFRDGFIRSLKVVTAEDDRIAAKSAVRVDGQTTIFEKGIFTPCKICEEHPERPPLWRIKARRIIHKKAEQNIYYRDAAFEIFGVPVAYAPYFFHPDPTVKRRSGFLIPQYSQSDDLGSTLEVPYFFNLAPNYDFTFNPRFTTEQGVLWQGTWRHRLRSGAYDFKFSAIDPENPAENAPGNSDFRGSIETNGAFELGNWWNWGWDVTVESDDTFRRFFKVDNIIRTDRVSKVYLIGQNDRNYFEANLYQFGGRLTQDTADSESITHPVIDYNYIFSDPVFGGELSLNNNVLSLSRDETGGDSNKVTSEIKWRKTVIDRLGQVYTPFLQARGDFYYASEAVNPITGVAVNSDEETTVRGVATAGGTYRYPFIAHTRNASHIIEPIAQILARPDIDNNNDVPNEDARSLVFDDTLLFDVDKFSGYDRIETGVRANVGVQYTMEFYEGGYARAVVGESFHLAGDNPFRQDTGLGTDRSDFVAGLYIAPTSNFFLAGQTRFDQDDLSVRRTDLFANVSYGPFGGTVNYANLKAQPALGILDDREEVYSTATLKLTDYWSLFGNIRYDIDGQQRIHDSIGVQYSDECFVLAVSYDESFVRDRDIEPDRAVTVRFFFKHLGGTSVSTGNLSDLIADSDDSKS